MTIRKKTLCLSFAIVPLAALVLLFTFPAEPLLLHRARRTAGTRGWLGYSWINNGALIVWRAASSQERGRVQMRVSRRDIASNRESRLDKLSSMVNEVPPSGDIVVSPGGEQALWTGQRDVGHRQQAAVVWCRLDGTQRRSVAEEEDCHALWSGDSAEIAVFTAASGNQLMLHGRIFARSTGSKSSEFAATAVPGPVDRISFAFAHGRLLTASGNGTEETGHATVCASALGNGAANRSHTVALPVRGYVGAGRFSPGGDRVAWMVLQMPQDDTFVQRVLHRFLPERPNGPDAKVSMWVSNIDGNDMHEIGCIPVPEADIFMAMPDSLPDRFDWLPDGTHLSFSYKHILYTVPCY